MARPIYKEYEVKEVITVKIGFCGRTVDIPIMISKEEFKEILKAEDEVEFLGTNGDHYIVKTNKIDYIIFKNNERRKRESGDIDKWQTTKI